MELIEINNEQFRQLLEAFIDFFNLIKRTYSITIVVPLQK